MKYNSNEKIWRVLYPDNNTACDGIVKEIADGLDISEICARIIYNRGYTSVNEAKKFTDVGIHTLHDSLLMCDVERAAECILSAVKNNERITIYGDYDVDGVTSVTLLYLYLSALGADVDYYIPSRIKEGYGVSAGAIAYLKEKGTKLIVTVDTGITAIDETLYAKQLGINTVITDHHECHMELPQACAVVNPHRIDCNYPFSELAGVGVVFKLICAMEIISSPDRTRDSVISEICEKYIDLVAIGTIADVMPLCDENRAIVKLGLSKIAQSDRCGLVALLDAMQSGSKNNVPVVGNAVTPKKRKINAGLIGFGIAPRINAAGRISSASKAVELLLCNDYEKAYTYAQELCEINLERQVEENSIACEAYDIIEKTHDFENDKVIVICNDSWKQGIIGIVASRITEKYSLPSILISFDGSFDAYQTPFDNGKGSGRSVKGLNLVEALGYCSDLLERYGGHELAAGLTVKREKVEDFKCRINEYARLHAPDLGKCEEREIDTVLSLSDATMSLAYELCMLEPFGIANPTPEFLITNVMVNKIIPMGGGKHTKILMNDGITSIQGVYFGVSCSELDLFPGDRIDVACRLNINEFRDTVSLQLIIQDMRFSSEYLAQIKNEEQIYASVKSGDFKGESDAIVPNRDEIIAVYKLLRREYSSGHTLMSYRMMASLVETYSGFAPNYVKLRLITDILNDIRVCICKDLTDMNFEFEVISGAEKTTIEASDTYRRLTAH